MASFKPAGRLEAAVAAEAYGRLLARVTLLDWWRSTALRRALHVRRDMMKYVQNRRAKEDEPLSYSASQSVSRKSHM